LLGFLKSPKQEAKAASWLGDCQFSRKKEMATTWRFNFTQIQDSVLVLLISLRSIKIAGPLSVLHKNHPLQGSANHKMMQ
jgi:hypothetical protein